MKYEHVRERARRVWYITDTHLGVFNNSNEWISLMDDYFHEFFLPLVRKEYRSGDVLLHLGDVFDSRQSINLRVLSLGVQIFEELSEIFSDGIFIIAGNHDLWGKGSTEINSLKSLKWIPNVTIIEEPVSLQLGDKSFFMMPWRKDHAEESDTLSAAHRHDYLCCHTDIRGLQFNRHVLVDSGAKIEEFHKFGRVYSGHIHFAQEAKNIKMLGSPYELTRSDLGNRKSITLLDLESGEETEFNNDFSPKFKRFDFAHLLEMEYWEIEKEFKNNFIDIYIDPVIAVKSPLNIISDTFVESRRIIFHPFTEVLPDEFGEELLEGEAREFTIQDFIHKYIERLDADDEYKARVLKSLNSLYRRATEI